MRCGTGTTRSVAAAIEASRGKVVKNLGDGLMATFAGATDAVAAAVAIQQAIGRHNRSGAEALGVRMGSAPGTSRSKTATASAPR